MMNLKKIILLLVMILSLVIVSGCDSDDEIPDI